MNINNPTPLGFIIANADEEFIHSFKRFPDGSTFKAWTLNPLAAYRFQSFQHARDSIRLLDHYGKLWVLDLFDTPTQVLVATENRDRPAWLNAISSMS
jgi:hypothetical protein